MSPNTTTTSATAFSSETFCPFSLLTGVPAAVAALPAPVPGLTGDDDCLACCFEEDPERWDGLS